MNGIVLIGPPGSGKSTIGKSIAREYNDKIYVSSGDIARKMAETNPTTKRFLANGLMAPEGQMRSEIYRHLYDINYCGKEFILDGFPRTTDQLMWLAERFPKLVIIHINTPLDVCKNRLLLRGRSDDTVDIINKRIQYYIDHTRPILDYTKYKTWSTEVV